MSGTGPAEPDVRNARDLVEADGPGVASALRSTRPDEYEAVLDADQKVLDQHYPSRRTR